LLCAHGARLAEGGKNEFRAAETEGGLM